MISEFSWFFSFFFLFSFFSLDASDYDEQRLASCFVCADVTDTCLNWAMMNEYYWPFLERWHH